MEILVKEPNKQFKLMEIEGSLKSMQDIVGGYIEVVKIPYKNVVLLCNEEGLINGLEENYAFGYPYRGTIFICNTDGEEFTSITEEEARDMFEKL